MSITTKKILTVATFLIVFLGLASSAHADTIQTTFPTPLANERELIITVHNTTKSAYDVKITVWNNNKTITKSTSLNALETDKVYATGTNPKEQYIVDIQASLSGTSSYSNIARYYAVMDTSMNPYIFDSPYNGSSSPSPAVTPAPSSQVAHFSCSDKKIFSNLANLTIADSATGGIGINEVTVAVLANPSIENPNPVLQTAYSQTQINGSKKAFVFSNLLPRTFYRVKAFDSDNKEVEEINDCQFTTDASPDPTASTTVDAPTELPGPTTLTMQDDTPAGANTPLTPVGVAPATSVGNISTVATSSGNGLIPCDGTDCTFNSVLQLINNLINFFFTTILLPLVVVMIMYLGYGYLTANGNPAQHAKLKSMLKNIVLGLLLIMCAWLIVHTLLSVLGYTDDLMFFSK